MDDLRKLKDYFEKQQEEEFGKRAYILSDSYYRTDEGRRRRQIKRKKIGYSYVFNEALKELCWKIEQEMHEEKRARERREKEPIEYERRDRRR